MRIREDAQPERFEKVENRGRYRSECFDRAEERPGEWVPANGAFQSLASARISCAGQSDKLGAPGKYVAINHQRQILIRLVPKVRPADG